MNQQQIPKVAVVICNKNYGHFIKDAIQSAALQDYPNKVIYIVDDASEDNSIEEIYKARGGKEFFRFGEENEQYIAEWANPSQDIKYAEIILFKLKKSGGPSRARNFAIKHAIENGCHIVAVLDSDDYMKQSKISIGVSKIMEDPERIGIVYFDYLILNTETNSITYESKLSYDFNKLAQDCIIHSGAIINVLSLRAVGLYDESLRVTEDYDLFLRICEKYMAIHVPIDGTVVRNQPMNSTSSVSKQKWEEDYKRTKMKMMQRRGLA